jgi:hypothetical protein
LRTLHDASYIERGLVPRGFGLAELTPHLGYTVQKLMQVFYEDTVENLAAYPYGKPIRVLT